MSLDRKTPKGYRKAWNGGKPPEETAQTEAFHRHLDACAQCREHPFELCGIGAILFANCIRAASEPIAAPRQETP